MIIVRVGEQSPLVYRGQCRRNVWIFEANEVKDGYVKCPHCDKKLKVRPVQRPRGDVLYGTCNKCGKVHKSLYDAGTITCCDIPVKMDRVLCYTDYDTFGVKCPVCDSHNAPVQKTNGEFSHMCPICKAHFTVEIM